ncbi:MAG: DnaJ domain-containing protein [Candidatus Parcubacteria bacterium]|nr:DnaJ domain-containing protein [Candidatus Parcubacteria bacterium]
MIGNIIAYGIMLVIVLILLYNLYAILRILTNKKEKKEDRTYKAKKNLFDFLMTLLRNFRRFLEFGQYGKSTVDPKAVAFASIIDQAMNNLNRADPALTAKKAILKQIEDTVKILEAALENAAKHRSLEAKTYIGECYQELKIISLSLDQQEVFSQINERIETIREQAQTLADAVTFDDAGADTDDGPNPSYNNPPPPKKTFYDILGVAKDIPQDEIKKIYRDLAKKYHPDRYADLADDMRQEAERRFKEINEAYTVLSDPKKRAEYDRQIA